MEVKMLEKALNRLYENSENYIQTQTESVVTQYAFAMINHKLNHYVTEYVKDNFTKMMDTIWERQFDKKNVLRRIEDEIDCTLTKNIDTYASHLFSQYMHQELKKKAKSLAAKMEVCNETN